MARPPKDEAEPRGHALSVHDALFTNRATRHLSREPVPRGDLEYLIEAATMAPSAGNLQMWSFVVVTDREQMRRMAETHREVGRVYIRDGVLKDPSTDEERRRIYTGALHNVEHLDQAGAIIVACLTLPCPDDASVASGLFGSIYPAVQNLTLAARARGLGSVLITLATDYSPVRPQKTEPLRKILELPRGVRAVALIPVGYPERPFARPRRDGWARCTHWDRWSPPSNDKGNDDG